MNFIMISPYFPDNYSKFCTALRKKGAKVLGIGNEAYDALSSQLKEDLTEYYRVNDLENYDEVYKACAYFAHKFGRIDRIESNNEHWLETDARLRTDFNVKGLKSEELMVMKHKSQMKDVFEGAGVKVAPGMLLKKPEDAKDFIDRHGYPVVVKPDCGVGASGTFKLNNPLDLENFLANEKGTAYFMESFVKGRIITYDGLTDQDGNIVFYSSMIFSVGIMEAVNEDLDSTYYIPRELPKNILEAGASSVKAFGLKERFFHLEFFLTEEKEVYALEINVRPPGGWTVDMFNFANDMDIFREYANVVTENRFTAKITRPYNCFYFGRKDSCSYSATQDDIIRHFGDKIVYHGPVATVFSSVLGNYGMIARTESLEEGFRMMSFAMEKRRTGS